MARLLHELLRRRRSVPTVAVDGRWRAWARALAARHARRATRRAGPAMAFLAPGATRTRWTRTVLTLQPQVRQAFERAAPGSGRAPAHGAPGAAAPPAVDRGAPIPRLLVAAPRAPILVAPARAAAAVQQRGVAASRPPMLVAPARAAAEYPRVGAALAASRLTIARIVERRRRVEEPRGLPLPERVRGTAPAARVAAVPPPATPADRADGWVPGRPPPVVAARRVRGATEAPPSPATAPAAAAPGRPPAAALDLEALTEQVVRQIDRRIVAHRERMGRI